MYIANIKEIDGIKVVLGVDTKKLDPVETLKKTKTSIENCREFKICQDKHSKIKNLTIDNGSINKQAQRIISRVAKNKGLNESDLKPEHFTSAELESFKNYDAKIKVNNDSINVIRTELTTANKTFEKKKVEIMKTEGVYFDIGKNEVEITDAVAKDYTSKLTAIAGSKQFLTLDGEIVPDNRNKTFFSLIDGIWEKLIPTSLSQEVDLTIYKLQEDLTEEEKIAIAEQFESDRLNNLTDDERDLEIQMALDNLMNRCVNYRSKLEIQGDKEALAKSQELYNTEKVLIEKKYKK